MVHFKIGISYPSGGHLVAKVFTAGNSQPTFEHQCSTIEEAILRLKDYMHGTFQEGDSIETEQPIGNVSAISHVHRKVSDAIAEMKIFETDRLRIHISNIHDQMNQAAGIGDVKSIRAAEKDLENLIETLESIEEINPNRDEHMIQIHAPTKDHRSVTQQEIKGPDDFRNLPVSKMIETAWAFGGEAIRKKTDTGQVIYFQIEHIELGKIRILYFEKVEG